MPETRLVNPFTTQGMIRDPRLFVGRAAELAEIWRRLRKRENVSIVGPRRIGKSSLLWRVLQQAPGELGGDPPPVVKYLSLELVPDAGDFFSRVAEMVAAEGETVRDVERALARHSLILCLDEFDQTVNEAAFPSDFFAALRGLAQGPSLALVVASKMRLGEFAGVSGMTSPFGNMFPPTPLVLGPLPKDEVRTLLTGLAGLAGVQFDESLVGEALRLTGGYPWNLQLIGSCWVEADRQWDAAKEKYRDALAQPMESLPAEPTPPGRESTPPRPPKKVTDWTANLAAGLTFVASASALYAVLARDPAGMWLALVAAAAVIVMGVRRWMATRSR